MCVCVCLSVCLSVCSLHKCMRFKQQLESTLHVTSWSGAALLLVLSGPWSPTPCRLVLNFDCFCTSLHDCIVSMQALALPALFILHCTNSGSPGSQSRCSITGSRTRAQQVFFFIVVQMYMFLLRYPIGSFSIPTVAALRPSEGPQRSALADLSSKSRPLANVTWISHTWSQNGTTFILEIGNQTTTLDKKKKNHPGDPW